MFVNQDLQGSSTPKTMPVTNEPLSPVFASSPTIQNNETFPDCLVGDFIKTFLASYTSKMSHRLKMQVLNYLFKLTVTEIGGMAFFTFVDPAFLASSLNAMKTLFDKGKHNLIFNLSQCFNVSNTLSSTRMPLDRMPYGMIDYNIRFFASPQTQKLSCEEHYASRLETMLAQFGHKRLCLHRGPVWQYEENSQPQGVDARSLVQIALDESGICLEDQL